MGTIKECRKYQGCDRVIKKESREMIRQLLRRRRRYVLVDIDTQKDFFLAEGHANIRNHRRVLAHIRRMMAWARTREVRIISISEIHPDNNGSSETDYCIDGTEGQQKINYTLLSDRMSFDADGSTDLPADLLQRHRQVILHKRCVDPFGEPRIERLLSELRADEFVLIGASTEGAIKATALGLLQRGKKVRVVIDAIGSHDNREANLALRKMEAKGAKLVETKKMAGVSHLQQVGICGCDSCQGQTKKASPDVLSKN